jgi:hypothetical protein
MKKLTFIILAIMMGTVACNNNSDQANQDNNSVETAAVETLNAAATSVVKNESEASLRTPADIPEEAQNKMYQIIFDYNKCMMLGRLDANQSGQSVQQAANDIMSSCESHMDSLKTHLLDNKVNESLVIGMTKKMRSRAARKLMTQGMNQMAAQAAAVESAEKMKATEAE